MSLGRLLGILCILLGFISAIISDAILFSPLTWFVAAIAVVVVLDFVGIPGIAVRREG